MSLLYGCEVVTVQWVMIDDPRYFDHKTSSQKDILS